MWMPLSYVCIFWEGWKRPSDDVGVVPNRKGEGLVKAEPCLALGCYTGLLRILGAGYLKVCWSPTPSPFTPLTDFWGGALSSGHRYNCPSFSPLSSALLLLFSLKQHLLHSAKEGGRGEMDKDGVCRISCCARSPGRIFLLDLLARQWGVCVCV